MAHPIYIWALLSDPLYECIYEKRPKSLGYLLFGR